MQKSNGFATNVCHSFLTFMDLIIALEFEQVTLAFKDYIYVNNYSTKALECLKSVSDLLQMDGNYWG